MLRVTVHEDDAFCRLELAGRLAGPWCSKSIDDTMLVSRNKRVSRDHRSGSRRSN